MRAGNALSTKMRGPQIYYKKKHLAKMGVQHMYIGGIHRVPRENGKEKTQPRDTLS